MAEAILVAQKIDNTDIDSLVDGIVSKFELIRDAEMFDTDKIVKKCHEVCTTTLMDIAVDQKNDPRITYLEDAVNKYNESILAFNNVQLSDVSVLSNKIGLVSSMLASVAGYYLGNSLNLSPVELISATILSAMVGYTKMRTAVQLHALKKDLEKIESMDLSAKYNFFDSIRDYIRLHESKSRAPKSTGERLWMDMVNGLGLYNKSPDNNDITSRLVNSLKTIKAEKGQSDIRTLADEFFNFGGNAFWYYQDLELYDSPALVELANLSMTYSSNSGKGHRLCYSSEFFLSILAGGFTASVGLSLGKYIAHYFSQSHTSLVLGGLVGGISGFALGFFGTFASLFALESHSAKKAFAHAHTDYVNGIEQFIQKYDKLNRN